MASIADYKTAEAFLDAYLRELAAVANRSPLTIRNYRNDIGQFLAWCREGEREPLEMTRALFRTYLGELRERGIVAASVTRRTSTIHAFYRYLQQENATERDLLFGVALRGLGLLPVLLVVVFATAWASRYAGLKTSIVLALGIALFCSGLFIKGLGLPLPLTGPWLSPSHWSPAPPPAAPAPTTPAQ